LTLKVGRDVLQASRRNIGEIMNEDKLTPKSKQDDSMGRDLYEAANINNPDAPRWEDLPEHGDPNEEI
jgi:hypothetical protein